MNITVYLGANKGIDSSLTMAVRKFRRMDWAEWKYIDIWRLKDRSYG